MKPQRNKKGGMQLHILQKINSLILLVLFLRLRSNKKSRSIWTRSVLKLID